MLRRAVLIPGLICFIMAVLTHFIAAGLRMSFSIVQVSAVVFAVQFAWLGCLVVIGAAGAYFAMMLGASPAQRIAAALFPAMISGWLTLTGCAITLIANSAIPFEARVFSALVMLMGWVVLPAGALGMGAMPLVAAGPALEAVKSRPLI